jgi:hypothetical protein
MDLLTESFKGLYPEKEPTKNMHIKYSGRFSDYNANVRYTSTDMTFSVSKTWRGINKDIKMGLIQTLMNKVFKTKIKTLNIDMYNIFLKKVHIAVPVDFSEPLLKEIFDEVNIEYFNAGIEDCNLKWGRQAKSKFGCYTYGKDMITINPILEDNLDLLKYVMYHEMLHKKFKFNSSQTGRSMHHTREFREWEKRYPNSEMIEKQLGILASRRYYKSRKTKVKIPKLIVDSPTKKLRSFFNWG